VEGIRKVLFGLVGVFRVNSWWFQLSLSVEVVLLCSGSVPSRIQTFGPHLRACCPLWVDGEWDELWFVGPLSSQLVQADGRPSWFWFWWRFLPIKREFFLPTVASCTIRTGDWIREKFQLSGSYLWFLSLVLIFGSHLRFLCLVLISGSHLRFLSPVLISGSHLRFLSPVLVSGSYVWFLFPVLISGSYLRFIYLVLRFFSTLAGSFCPLGWFERSSVKEDKNTFDGQIWARKYDITLL